MLRQSPSCDSSPCAWPRSPDPEDPPGRSLVIATKRRGTSSSPLPSQVPQLLLVPVFSGSGPAAGSAHFGHFASVCPPCWPGMPAGPSTSTTSAPAPGSVRCNNVDEIAQDESAARSLSADNTACAAGVLTASADPLEFRDTCRTLGRAHGR